MKEMNYLNTSQLDLHKNGYAILPGKNLPENPKIGDLVKITLEIVSPLDFDKSEIRSVSHEDLWIEIKQIEQNNLVGILKSLPTHDLQIKDGAKFSLGDEFFLLKENIQTIREA